MPLVDDAQIKSASLHNPLPQALHWYIAPFLLIWPIFFAIYLNEDSYIDYIDGQEWTFVFSGSIFTAQSLLWLMTQWNVDLKARFTSTAARNVRTARLIKVLPVANAGSAEICDLQRDAFGGKENLSFVFQRRRFLFNPDTNSFAPVSFKIDQDPAPACGDFQATKGNTSPSELEKLEHHYGDNAFNIPVPTFTELFKEHAVAPFFVFQVFCVGLWMLDEYWYYSLFTLFMLVAFESTVVFQRQRTLTEFRGMSIKPYGIWVHRNKGWEEIQSDKLLPGDLVSVGRTKEDSGVACDMLLVQGSAIVNEAMLSGESTPVLKDSIQLRPKDARIDHEGLDKNAFLWGGTKVLQTTHSVEAQEGAAAASVPPPPDNGVLAVVVKTGFETSQGSLVRTMIFATERVSANNVEALLFILFLLCFAIAASWYVWTKGVESDRKRSKLMLDCVLIITSVVPPELPMELSLAVNTSLAALSKLAIFCTEPFRIPFAGRIDIACFDKTGTLTGEDLVVDGVAGLELLEQNGSASGPGKAYTSLAPVHSVGIHTTLVLGTAHALVKLDDGDVVGEPMEKATLKSLGWTLNEKDTLTSKNPIQPVSAQIKRRFQFSSALKRQSSVATVSLTNRETKRKQMSTIASVKGAPETIRKYLVHAPPNYEETFKHFTRNGGRVLALAYKYILEDGELGQTRVNNLKREEVESDLHFAGFLVLQCPLKEDAKQAVIMLNESSHRVVMITGDNPLTAVHVARQVEIVDRDALILDAPDNDESGENLVWKSVDDTVNIPVDPSKPIAKEILESKDICLTGFALAKYKDNTAAFHQLLRHTWVYARVSPKQKEEILIGLRDLGYTTCMCGDGTNDVGALKQAHIGVALLNGTQEALNKIAENWRTNNMKNVYEKQASLMQRFNQPPPPVPQQIAHLYPPGPTNPHYQKAIDREAEKKAATADAKAKAVTGAAPVNGTPSNPPQPDAKALQQISPEMSVEERKKIEASNKAASLADRFTSGMLADLDEDEPPTLKLGDASVAAPFTSKLANVVAIPNIIRQGRCTLVSTIQMYKILALNCLISAYSLSVLYLDGIKFGDAQMTISGMLMSVCFLSLSRAKTVEQLSRERPQPNIFNTYIIGSVLGQFAIHIVTLVYISRFVAWKDPKNVDITFDPDDEEHKFEPSLLNSAIYLLQLVQQVSTFAVNYQGRPFRESIRENKGMFYGIMLVSGVAFSCAIEFVPEINERMKLVPFDQDFQIRMIGVMVVDFAGCWIIERGLKALYSDFRPKDIAKRRPEQVKRDDERREAREDRERGEREKAKAEDLKKRREQAQAAVDAWRGKK